MLKSEKNLAANSICSSIRDILLEKKKGKIQYFALAELNDRLNNKLHTNCY